MIEFDGQLSDLLVPLDIKMIEGEFCITFQNVWLNDDYSRDNGRRFDRTTEFEAEDKVEPTVDRPYHK